MIFFKIFIMPVNSKFTIVDNKGLGIQFSTIYEFSKQIK